MLSALILHIEEQFAIVTQFILHCEPSRFILEKGRSSLNAQESVEEVDRILEVAFHLKGTLLTQESLLLAESDNVLCFPVRTLIGQNFNATLLGNGDHRSLTSQVNTNGSNLSSLHKIQNFLSIQNFNSLYSLYNRSFYAIKNILMLCVINLQNFYNVIVIMVWGISSTIRCI